MPDRKVDPNDPLPRYYRMYTSLLERIQSGEFTPGSAIPTERELGDEYGVSRITVIKALDMLERDGHIGRQQGRGTFVADPAVRAEITNGQIGFPTLGFVSFNLDHPYLSNILTGIAGVAAQQGHPLHIFGSVKSSQEETTAINDAMRRGVQGLIVNPWREYRNVPLYADLLARRFPAGHGRSLLHRGRQRLRGLRKRSSRIRRNQCADQPRPYAHRFHPFSRPTRRPVCASV